MGSFLEVEQKIEEIYKQSQFLKIKPKTSFHSILKYIRHLGFFFQKFQRIRHQIIRILKNAEAYHFQKLAKIFSKPNFIKKKCLL
jgi:endonuclease III-like uncharacterized protein